MTDTKSKCLICGKPLHAGKKYCSFECRNISYKGKRFSKRTEFKKGQGIVIVPAQIKKKIIRDYTSDLNCSVDDLIKKYGYKRPAILRLFREAKVRKKSMSKIKKGKHHTKKRVYSEKARESFRKAKLRLKKDNKKWDLFIKREKKSHIGQVPVNKGIPVIQTTGKQEKEILRLFKISDLSLKGIGEKVGLNWGIIKRVLKEKGITSDMIMKRQRGIHAKYIKKLSNTPKKKKEHSRRMRKWFSDPENKKGFINIKKKSMAREDVRKKVSKARKAYLKSHPEKEERRLEKLRKTTDSKEWRKTRGDLTRLQFQDPQQRKRQSRMASDRIEDAGANWQGGIGKYPYHYDFNKPNKIKVAERDKWTCQRCGKKTSKGEGSVHHINYDKLDNNLEHWVWTCRSCNSSFNSKFHRDYWFAWWCYKLGKHPEDMVR